MNIFNKTLVFSVQQKEASASVNAKNHAYTLSLLRSRNIPFIVALGSFEGILEPSIILSASHEELVKQLTKEFNQDCYLFIDANQYCSLHNSNGE